MVTGGAGFIGGHVIAKLLYMGHEVVNLDSHTYAARPRFVRQVASKNSDNYMEIRLDLGVHITHLKNTLLDWKPELIIHLAAESHVCNSIRSPRPFLESNVTGTFNLLEALRQLNMLDTCRLVHVSTDEVFGDCQLEGYDAFRHDTPVKPRSPYAASKAASDLFVQAWCHTYGLKAIVTNCSNNYGPNQHTEKLIPNTIHQIYNNRPVRVYGTGQQVRDWLWVEEHADCLIKLALATHLRWEGERYCIGGELPLTNLEIIEHVYQAFEAVNGVKVCRNLEFTNQRPTDDLRYEVDTSRTRLAADWRPRPDMLPLRLQQTVLWYLENEWLNPEVAIGT
jgi:dTDP-glucose 4,6-dehydratase